VTEAASQLAGLDGARVRAVDSSRLIDDVVLLGHQLEDALWRAEAAGLPQRRAPALVVCGMGGSAIGADLARAIAGERLGGPLVTVRGDDPRPWLATGALVLCSSYSGATAETLACFDAARRAGADLVVATTGGPLAERARASGVPVIGIPQGLEPRCAVAYVIVAALAAAHSAGLVPDLADELAAAARTTTALAAQWGSDSPQDTGPKRLAGDLAGRVPVFHGIGLTAAPARRFKTQWNENAKLPAFWSELPEQNHNEICAWVGEAQMAGLAPVLLASELLAPPSRVRLQATAEALERAGFTPLLVEGAGATRAEQILSLVLHGDLASVYAAVLAGRDPRPVAAITALKERLAAADSESS